MSDWTKAGQRAKALQEIAIEYNVAIISGAQSPGVAADGTDGSEIIFESDLDRIRVAEGDELEKVMRKRARAHDAERIRSLAHELSEYVRGTRTNARELEMKRWVEAGDVAIHSLYSGTLGVGVVVAMPNEKRVVADIPGVLSSDDARWLGLRLIEAATLAEGVCVVEDGGDHAPSSSRSPRGRAASGGLAPQGP